MEKNQPILEINDLSVNVKSFKKIEKILSKINFVINENEIVSVVGETGAGKTTLAKTILGYNKFYEGKIFIDGKEISNDGMKSVNWKNKWIFENVQMIFENATSSLNPNEKIKRILERSFKNFKILEKEEEIAMNLLLYDKEEIEKQLFEYKYPEKYQANEMLDKVENIINNEEQLFYKENVKTKFFQEQMQEFKKIKEEIGKLKLEEKKYRRNYHEKTKFLREEKITEIRKIKKNYEHDKKITRMSFYDEKQAVFFNDDEYFLKVLNFSIILQEILAFVKNCEKAIKGNPELSNFLKIGNFKLETITNEETIKENRTKIIEFLDYLLTGMGKFEVIENQIVRINYIKNLLLIKSPINTIVFQKLINHVNLQIDKRIEEQTEIIENLEKYINFLKMKSKRIINKKLIILKKDEILSLNYELVIFIEIKKMFLEFLEKAKQEVYIHNFENLKNYYQIILSYNKMFAKIYLSIMNWKFKNQKKLFKKEFHLQKKENKQTIDDKKLKKSEIEKIIKENSWIKIQIDEKLEILRENIVKDINKVESSRKDMGENSTIEVTKKIKELELERTKILTAIEKLNKIYSKENRENVLKEKIVDIFTILNLPLNILDHYPFQFPNSVKQKIVIARALISNPKLIIADEAVTSLDSITRFEIVEILKLIKEKYNISILFITNDFEIIKYISDRIYVFQYGAIVEYGKTSYIYNYPIHPYTKFFLNKTITSKIEKKQISYSMREDKIQIYNKYKDIIAFEVQNDHFVNATLFEIEKWLNNSRLKKNIKNVKSF